MRVVLVSDETVCCLRRRGCVFWRGRKRPTANQTIWISSCLSKSGDNINQGISNNLAIVYARTVSQPDIQPWEERSGEREIPYTIPAGGTIVLYGMYSSQKIGIAPSTRLFPMQRVNNVVKNRAKYRAAATNMYTFVDAVHTDWCDRHSHGGTVLRHMKR